ncbi:dehydrogenase [Paenibacillus sp. Marseille-P2973]|uniref:dehydrogenase n=1 Tax=Paenibacillus TaxID=44249 RepID=UPI001B36E399|nr:MULTISPECIES: dehydrogenase [Paenibacillus]MBQ4901981.1 dehydrogenase [Paenibacillus sp. Marseille-P2973]MDN4068102.1 dehydrogenase [Paenibacillus vini]
MNNKPGKHASPLPTPRKIRRGCSKELYRTVKRLGVYIPEERIREGEELYYKKVIGNLMWIAEHTSNRKVLADWWDEAVSAELADLWQVDRETLSRAFRSAFGG